MAWRQQGGLNQWWLVYWCIYVSLGHNELANNDLNMFFVEVIIENGQWILARYFFT